MLCLWALSAGAAAAEHPVPLDKNFDPAKCVECHADKTQGKFVHTAMEMGCTACHVIANEQGTTSVSLMAPANQLCFNCHDKSDDPVQHLPYAEGACTVCHSPHASAFPAHTLVSHQELCMGCHVRGLPKVDDAKKTVTVPWGRSLTFQQMNGWRYIDLNQSHTANHPIAGHPVSGDNRALGKGEVTCLSCHQPHHSKLPNLLPANVKSQEALCVSCHTNF